MRDIHDTGRGRQAIFRGWIVVAACFAVLFLAFGSTYAFGIFFESLQREFRADRGSISLVFSVAGFLYFALGALSGRIADRIGPRRVVVFGIIVVGAGLILASQAETLWQVFVSYGLGIGIGVGFAYVPAVGVVQRWFVRRRGLASGVAVTGIGLGTLCVPPFAALLIEWDGWRTAYLVLGVVVLSLGGIAAMLIDDSPARHGLLPDGDLAPDTEAGPGEKTAATPSRPPDTGISLAQALRSRPFWMLYASAFMASLGIFIPFVHLVPYAQDAGLTKSTGVMLFAMIGAGSTAGRFLFGGLADRLGRRRFLACLYVGIAAMFLWWLIATSIWELVVFSLIFGACYGGFVALAPAVTADYFDGKDVIGVIGILYTSVAVGTLAGPTLAGVAFDLWQSYTLPILVASATSLAAAAIVLLAEEPARWRRRAQA